MLFQVRCPHFWRTALTKRFVELGLAPVCCLGVVSVSPSAPEPLFWPSGEMCVGLYLQTATERSLGSVLVSTKLPCPQRGGDAGGDIGNPALPQEMHLLHGRIILSEQEKRLAALPGP